ncbi:MAG TPA: S8 family serine peptidase [Anaerolineales bacterium]|nr:S8 family serine peptidase [Anaerolineales bacterium]
MLLLAAVFAAGGSASLASPTAWQAKVDPWVQSTASQVESEFLVFLSEQADLSGASGLKTKGEKGQYVFEQLSATAKRTQAPVLAVLEAHGVAHQPFWVANMIWARGDIKLIQALAARQDVAHIFANPAVRLDEPARHPAAEQSLAADAIEWNILKVNADNLWALGYSGQGAVVGGQDTGYDWDHPALVNQYRGWDGASADHNYHWHDAIHSGGGVCGPDSPVPCDDHNHGTHTMGTMVGAGGGANGGSNQIGMAPGARWIGCRNMDQGVGTPASYSECYQWFIAPTDLNGNNPRPDLAPDVINNSWSCPPSEGCSDPNALLAVVNNVRAAGILTVHAAGNSGFLGCSSISDPAAIYEASFSVGATNSTDLIASFSSRGPVTIDDSNRLKPDISAPGVNVRSSVRNGGYAILSGTSMAAPHVAGLAALLISADPALRGDVDRLESLIESGALPRTTAQNCGGVPGTQIPNNTYGWGRADALGSLEALMGITERSFLPLVLGGP